MSNFLWFVTVEGLKLVKRGNGTDGGIMFGGRKSGGDYIIEGLIGRTEV